MNPHDYLALVWTERELWLFFYFGIALECSGDILMHLFYTSFITLTLREKSEQREFLSLIRELIAEQLTFRLGPCRFEYYWSGLYCDVSIRPDDNELGPDLNLVLQIDTLPVWAFHIIIKNCQLFYVSSDRPILTKLTTSDSFLLLLDEAIIRVAHIYGKQEQVFLRLRPSS